MNAAVALALCLLTTVAPPAPAAPSATYVIGPGQERRIERVLAEAVAGLVLLDAAVEQDRVVARFGRAPGADASFAVTLVHPETAPADALQARGVAILPEPGPAPAKRLSALAAALRNGDSQPLVAWTQPSPEPAPPALAKAARRLPGGEPGEWALQAAAPPAGGDVRAGDTPPPDQPEAVLRDDEGDPSDPAWRQVITRAEHLAERGDRDAAREALAPMSGRAGASNWLRVDLAAAYAQIGDVERARALVAPALATDARWLALAVTGDLPPADDVVRGTSGGGPCGALEAARMLRRVGDKPGSEALLEAIVRAGGCPRAVEALGQLMLDARRQEEALAFLLEHRPTDPPDAGVETLVGHTLRNVGRYQESIDILEPLARADPQGMSRLLAPILTMYLWLGKERAPLDQWRREARATPGDVVSTFLLGAVLHYRGEYEESLQWMNSLVGRLDDVPRVYIYRGMDYLNLGDPVRARELLDQATQLPYVDPDVYFCRAEVERDRDRALAIADLERFLTLKRKLTYSYGFKIFRVEQMLAALERCQRDGTEECPGPFEHPRHRFVDRFAMRLALALAAALLVAGAIALWRRRQRR